MRKRLAESPAAWGLGRAGKGQRVAFLTVQLVLGLLRLGRSCLSPHPGIQGLPQPFPLCAL